MAFRLVCPKLFPGWSSYTRLGVGCNVMKERGVRQVSIGHLSVGAPVATTMAVSNVTVIRCDGEHVPGDPLSGGGIPGGWWRGPSAEWRTTPPGPASLCPVSRPPAPALALPRGATAALRRLHSVLVEQAASHHVDSNIEFGCLQLFYQLN